MSGSRQAKVALTVNTVAHDVEVPASTTLVELLRSRLALTGTKVACDGGECGACTVLVNGQPTLSCLVLVAELSGAQVTTIESADDERVRDLQRAFVEMGALQCGFCTPGVIMAASRLAAGADAETIRNALVGNLCRCTGYAKIVAAVERVLRQGNDDE